jgi:hypothetical protein
VPHAGVAESSRVSGSVCLYMRGHHGTLTLANINHEVVLLKVLAHLISPVVVSEQVIGCSLTNA